MLSVVPFLSIAEGLKSKTYRRLFYKKIQLNQSFQNTEKEGQRQG